MFDPRLTFEILRQNGVSLAEYYILGTVGYGIFLSPEELARQSVKLSGGDPRGTLTEREHFQAVLSCVEKKWLEIVKSERYRGDTVLEVGTVDFTSEGSALYQQIINKIFGEDFITGYETL